MKKIKTAITFMAVALAIGFTSCDKNDDEGDGSTQYFTVPMPTLVTGNGVAATYDVSYRLDFSLQKMVLSASPTFGSLQFGFKTDEVKFTVNGNTFSANAGNCTKVQGVAGVNDVRIKFNPMPVVPPETNGLGIGYYENPWLLTRYEVLPGMKAYTYPLRATFKGTFKSTYPGQQQPFETNECMVEYSIDLANRKADVYFYNAKFAAPMPAQKVMRLKDLTVNFTDDGIELLGLNIVPSLLEGNDYTPYADYTFNKIEFEIETPNMTDCEIDFTVAGRFTGEFEGSSIQ